MAYTVNKTNGTILATVADGTIDTTSDLTLVGKNYAGYGEFLNENSIKLLENFANSSAPSSPLAGQLWWDTTNSLMKTYTGTSWKTISSSTSSASTPTGSVTGDLWWDTTNGQLKVYNGTSFTLIGPSFTSGTGTSGAIVETVTDSGATDHVVVKLYTNNTLVATVSKDSTFTPQSAISGFSTIKPGIQLSTSVSNNKFQGTATDSDALGGIAAANYLRSNASDSTSGVLSILNDTGLVVGVDSDLTVGVSGSDVSISNTTSDGDILIKVNDGGVTTTAMTIDGATSRVLLAGSPTESLGAATKAYVDSQVSGAGSLLLTGGTMTGDILVSGTVDFGSAGNRINEVFATDFNGKVSQVDVGGTGRSAATTATANTIVARDASGDVYATNFQGNLTGNVTGNVTGNITGDVTGDVTGNVIGNLTGDVTGNVSGNAGTVTVTQNDTTNETLYLMLADGFSGAQGAEADSDLTYNPSTNTLTATNFAGTSSSAQYADLAEKFRPDTTYAPGTIVALGGVEEITAVNEELSDDVFGVISNEPAYLMNAGQTGGAPVAIAGRVPVRCVGIINKGDRLVSAGNGLARAAHKSESISAFNVIGRALTNKTTTSEGTVEAFVTIN